MSIREQHREKKSIRKNTRIGITTSLIVKEKFQDSIQRRNRNRAKMIDSVFRSDCEKKISEDKYRVW